MFLIGMILCMQGINQTYMEIIMLLMVSNVRVASLLGKRKRCKIECELNHVILGL
jgi:hypothetical protein